VPFGVLVKIVTLFLPKQTLRLTAEMIENLSALSGVAYENLGAIFPSLIAPKPAPTRIKHVPVLEVRKTVSGPYLILVDTRHRAERESLANEDVYY